MEEADASSHKWTVLYVLLGKGLSPLAPSGLAGASVPRHIPVSPHHLVGTYLEKDNKDVAVTPAPAWAARTGSAASPWGETGSPGKEDKEKNPPSAQPPLPKGASQCPHPC